MSTELHIPEAVLRASEQVRMWMLQNGCTELAGIALRTELQQAQAALAAVTLERDEAKEEFKLMAAAFKAKAADSDAQKRLIELYDDQYVHKSEVAEANGERNRFERQFNHVSAQLAACQSREAKALEALPHVLGHPADADWCAAVDEHHAATEADCKEAEADRDQLQAQVGALQGALEAFDPSLFHLFDERAADRVEHIFKQREAALAQPAPAAPDSAKDGARLDWLDAMKPRVRMETEDEVSHMIITITMPCGQNLPACATVRAAIDAAMAATPPNATP